LAVQFAHQTVQLTASVGHDNPASARVLEKAGFKQDADQSNDSTLIYVWNGTHEAV
jgi:RimJ/RimL family protein N-acetyltransferase